MQTTLMGWWIRVLVLLVAMLTSACTANDGKPAENAIQSVAEKRGPYHDLIFLSENQVTDRLGKPDRVENKGKNQFWTYDWIGLRLHFFDGKLAFVDQTQGQVMSDVSIGDDEDKLLEMAAKVEVGKEDTKILTVVRNDLEYLFVSAGGKVVSVKFGPPSLP